MCKRICRFQAASCAKILVGKLSTRICRPAVIKVLDSGGGLDWQSLAKVSKDLIDHYRLLLPVLIGSVVIHGDLAGVTLAAITVVAVVTTIGGVATGRWLFPGLYREQIMVIVGVVALGTYWPILMWVLTFWPRGWF